MLGCATVKGGVPRRATLRKSKESLSAERRGWGIEGAGTGGYITRSPYNATPQFST